MTVEKGLVALATQMKTYVDEKDQIVLDIIQESNDKLNEVYDLVKAIPAGEQGPQGEQGLQGEVGPQGEKGLDGTSVTVEEAIASLIADEEFIAAVKGPQGEQGLIGEKGDKGEQGEAGKSVTLDEVKEVLIQDSEFVKSLVGAQGEQGPQGEKGDNGNSVTVDELKSSFLSDEEFIKAITGPQGQEGVAGPVGEKGATGDQGPQGEIGPEGLSIKAFEITDEGALTIEMNDGQMIDLGVIKGADGQNGIDGKDFDAEEFLTLFKCDNDLIEALKVSPEDVKKHLDVIVAEWNSSYTEQFKSIVQDTQAQVETKLAVVDEFLANQEVIAKSAEEELTILKSSLEDEVKDATGELIEMQKQAVAEQIFEFDKAIAVANTKSLQLEMAIAEANRAKVQQWTPDTVIKAGQWVEHDGRYYVANRDSDSVPGNSTAYSLVLRGFEFRKAWNADTTYERLDVVISSSGSAWIANKSQPQGEPGSTPDWNLLCKRGERGAKGDMGQQGPQGEKGFDAADIIDAAYDYDTESLSFIKSDGSRISFDLPVLSLVQDLVTKQWLERLDQFELPINDFRGLWNSNTTYQRGDVVTFTNGVSIAKQTVSGVAPMEFLSADSMKQAGDSWQLMMAIAPALTGGTGGAGGVGEPGPAGPRGPIGPKGDTGPAGPQGPIGATGPQGPAGADGAIGPAGPAGVDGIDGTDGSSARYAGRIETYTELEALMPTARPGQFYITNDRGEGYYALESSNTPGTVSAWEFMGRLIGADGVEGPAGPTGPQGPAGMGINLKGHVPTEADLPTGASQGDTYVVDATGNAWSWSATDSAYLDIGKIVGPQGEQGIQGPQGPAGADGAQGPAGADGKNGLPGKDGVDGAVGPQGPAGADGAVGPAGADGAAGPQGEQGIQGPKGDLGATGDVGPKGDIGNTGPQGEVGPVGPKGDQGLTGADGPKGDVGPKGDQGDQGIPGLGITFKGRVATVGDLPATATQGDMYIIDATGDAWVWDDGAAAFENAGPIVGPTGPQGEVGAEGAVGPTGPQGPAGPTAVSADADNTAVLGTDGLLYVGKPVGYLPTAGGDMTGPINVKGDGAVAFMMDNGFNFQAVLTSTALRYGTKSVLGFTADSVVAAVPFRILNAPSTDEHATNKKYVDDLVAANSGGGATGAYLPLTGGTMTGPITAPSSATAMNFTNTYSMYSANGGVSFRFGATDLIAFSNSGLIAYKPFVTPATGIGVQFGSGGGYIAKSGTGIGVYAGGSLRFTISDTANCMVPLALSVSPTAPNHAATKSYVDEQVAASGGATIVSIADGATEPAASSYPEGALLVRYTP